MKLILEVKNNKKIINPSRDDILLYDGKEWFVTTKKIYLGNMTKNSQINWQNVKKKLPN